MDPPLAIPEAGLAGDAEQRGDEQRRLDALAHEDAAGCDGAGHEALPRGARADEPLGAVDVGEQRAHPRVDLGGRRSRVERGAQREEALLDGGYQRRIGRAQGALGGLDALQVGVDHGRSGRAAIAVRGQETRPIEPRPRQGEGALARAILVGGAAAQVGEEPVEAPLGEARRRELPPQLLVGSHRELRQGVRRRVVGGRRGVPQPGHVERERPAIRGGEEAERHHGGAVEPELDRAVDAEGRERIADAGIVEVGRVRFERAGAVGVGVAVRAVTGGAVLGVEGAAPALVGRRGGRLGELEGGGHRRAHRGHRGGDLRLGRLAVDERAHPGDLLREVRARSRLRRRTEPRGNLPRVGEQGDLLGILRGADDDASGDRSAVVARGVPEDVHEALCLDLGRIPFVSARAPGQERQRGQQDHHGEAREVDNHVQQRS